MRLGPITFREFEVASGVSFGGQQAVVKHKLGSGRQVVDVLGPDTANIRFSGVFSGEAALRRAQALDRIRKMGRQVELSWGALRYTVIVSQFSASYETRLWIPYEAVCTVIQTEDTCYAGNPKVSSDELAASMLTAATTLVASIPVGSDLQPRLGFPDDGLANVTQATLDAATLAQAQVALSVSILAYESQFAEALSVSQQAGADAAIAFAQLDQSCQGMCTLIAAGAYLAVAGLTTGAR